MDTHEYSQTHIERHKHILSSIDTKIHTTDEKTQYVLNTILLRSIKSRQWDPGGEQRDNVVEGTKEFELCSTQDLATKVQFIQSAMHIAQVWNAQIVHST